MEQSQVITSALTEPVVVNRAPEMRRAQTEGNVSFWALLRNPFRSVKITQEDINAGVRGDGGSCALAVAWKRTYPDDVVDISGEKPKINGQEIPFTDTLVDWIEKFDNGEPVETLTVNFYGPEE